MLCPLEGLYLDFHLDASNLRYLGLFLLTPNVADLTYIGYHSILCFPLWLIYFRLNYIVSCRYYFRLPYTLPNMKLLLLLLSHILVTKNKWNHHLSAEICTLLFTFSISIIAWKLLLWPDPPDYYCEGAKTNLVSFCISCVACR